jgi:hypothetical protein
MIFRFMRRLPFFKRNIVSSFDLRNLVVMLSQHRRTRNERDFTLEPRKLKLLFGSTLFLLACQTEKSVDTAETVNTNEPSDEIAAEDIYCEPTTASDLRLLYGYVGDLNSDQEGVPTGIEANSLQGVTITSCNTGEQVVSDEEGNWRIDVPNQDYISLNISFDGYLPSRWMMGPLYEGIGAGITEKFSNTIASPEFISEVFGEAGVTWEETLGLVVVDVLNPNLHDSETGSDLIGSVISLISVDSLAMVVDDEERMLIEGNVLSEHSDVIFVNAGIGKLEFDIETSDGSICTYPENMYSRAGEIFHISIYCH